MRIRTYDLAGDPARPRPVDAARAEITSALEDGGNSWMLFIIRDLEHDQPVGLTELSDINLRHRTATFGIRLGDNETRRRGLGGEAASLTLDYGFVCLDLVNIAAETHVFNTAALALYQRLGFRVIGHRRQAYRLAGIPHDEIHLDCLADEFIRASPPVAVLPPIR